MKIFDMAFENDFHCDSRDAVFYSPIYSVKACHDCGLVQCLPNEKSAKLRCSRCSALLQNVYRGSLSKALAINLAAIVFFILANSFPIVAIQATGNTTFATILGVAIALQDQNMDVVALVVIGTTIAFPGLDLLFTSVLIVFAKRRHLSVVLTWVFRLRSAIKPWSMVEIFVLGTLVAIVKLGSIANVVTGIGLWSLCTFIVLSSIVSVTFDPVEFWDEVGNSDE